MSAIQLVKLKKEKLSHSEVAKIYHKNGFSPHEMVKKKKTNLYKSVLRVLSHLRMLRVQLECLISA